MQKSFIWQYLEMGSLAEVLLPLASTLFGASKQSMKEIPSVISRIYSQFFFLNDKGKTGMCSPKRSRLGISRLSLQEVIRRGRSLIA